MNKTIIVNGYLITIINDLELVNLLKEYGNYSSEFNVRNCKVKIRDTPKSTFIVIEELNTVLKITPVIKVSDLELIIDHFVK